MNITDKNMEQGFADILTDAFSEIYLPSSADEELDFETLHYDATMEVAEVSNYHGKMPVLTEEDGVLHQDITDNAIERHGSLETITAEHNDDRKSQRNYTDIKCTLVSTDKSPQKDCECSVDKSEQENANLCKDEEEEEDEEEEDEEGEDEEEDNDGDDDDSDGQSEKNGSPQVRKKDQAESDSDEDLTSFQEAPRRTGGRTIQDDRMEERELRRTGESLKDTSDSECEDMTIQILKDIRKEEDSVIQNLLKDDGDRVREEALAFQSDFLEIPMQNLQDPITEDSADGHVAAKIKGFTGDDYQEAGESFADYPSDFSSSEYSRNESKDEEKNKLGSSPWTSKRVSQTNETACQERGLMERTSVDVAEDAAENLQQVGDMEWEGMDDYGDVVTSGTATGGTVKREFNEFIEDMFNDASKQACYKGDEVFSLRYQSTQDDTSSEEGKELENWEQAVVSTSSSSDEAEPKCARYLFSRDNDCSPQQLQSEIAISHLCQDGNHVKQNKRGDSESVHLSFEDGCAFAKDPSSNIAAITSNFNKVRPLAFTASKSDNLLSGDVFVNSEDKEERLLHEVMWISAKEVQDDVHQEANSRDEMDSTVNSFKQGSVDDDFLFEIDQPSRISDLGQFADDESDDERGWRQEQERIKAFNKFYDSEEGEGALGREGRKTKVQFCTDELSQIIHYETDSSLDLFDSSTDEEEDLNATESPEERIASDIADTDFIPCPYNNLSTEGILTVHKTQLHFKHKCLGLLKLMLKIGLMVMLGLCVLWWGTDQMDWPSQLCTIFKG